MYIFSKSYMAVCSIVNFCLILSINRQIIINLIHDETTITLIRLYDSTLRVVRYRGC